MQGRPGTALSAGTHRPFPPSRLLSAPPFCSAGPARCVLLRREGVLLAGSCPVPGGGRGVKGRRGGTAPRWAGRSTCPLREGSTWNSRSGAANEGAEGAGPARAAGAWGQR